MKSAPATSDGRAGPGLGDNPLDARKARLIDVLEDVGAKTLRYLYDFGDGWEHTIKIERAFDAAPGVQYPRLIEAVGRCPPEDCGGPYGYPEFLEAIADPKHERHAELIEWNGGAFDPTDADFDARADNLASLAKKWTRKPSSKRSK